MIFPSEKWSGKLITSDEVKKEKLEVVPVCVCMCVCPSQPALGARLARHMVLGIEPWSLNLPMLA